MKPKAIVGGVLAIIFAGVLIYSWETEKSLVQIAAGFVFFILPSIFFGSFTSGRMMFIFIFTTAILAYISYKMEFNDVWIGIAMASLLGIVINRITIKPYQVFDAEQYKLKNRQKRQSE